MTNAGAPLDEKIAEVIYLSWHRSVPFAEQSDDVRAEYLRAARSVVDMLADEEVIILVAEEEAP